MEIALKTVFEEKIPQALSRRPELAREINAHVPELLPQEGCWGPLIRKQLCGRSG
jgi:hypothetical protein